MAYSHYQTENVAIHGWILTLAVLPCCAFANVVPAILSLQKEVKSCLLYLKLKYSALQIIVFCFFFYKSQALKWKKDKKFK